MANLISNFLGIGSLLQDVNVKSSFVNVGVYLNWFLLLTGLKPFGCTIDQSDASSYITSFVSSSKKKNTDSGVEQFNLI